MSASDSRPRGDRAVGPAERRTREIREQARRRISRELENERVERHARGERLVAGLWVPERLAARVQRARVHRHRVAFVELLLLAAMLVLLLAVVWRAFGFLFLPHVITFLE